MRNKKREEEKECREDMSQRGGVEREEVRKRGVEQRGEEMFICSPKSCGSSPLPVSIYPSPPPAAFNGQIRDKRTREETVSREKRGDPSVSK